MKQISCLLTEILAKPLHMIAECFLVHSSMIDDIQNISKFSKLPGKGLELSYSRLHISVGGTMKNGDNIVITTRSHARVDTNQGRNNKTISPFE